MNIRLSRNLAILLGILAALLETVRRWHTWQQDPLALFDDYILGGLLLYGAYRAGKDQATGQKYLVGGWGFALGLAYASVDSQVQMVRTGMADPAPVSAEWVLVVKLIGFALILLGFITSLRRVSNI